ncbi:unnamed protein product [Rhizoctonia solani]|uniref:RRM domain-containing protein n=1 Tax=Rhizoctonia solani TaxID=456999 RepID=A0A8H3DZN2_9AGAM|nr:unnamed protein product [Rhizoctonia solani]
MVYYVSALELYDHNHHSPIIITPSMHHTRSHMPQPHATPSPPSYHSSPQVPPKVATLNISIWSDDHNPNVRSADINGEGNMSKFFSRRTSSIGSSHSAGSRSPPRWPIQAQPPVVQPQPVLHRPFYPAPSAIDELSYELQHTSISSERELHVVLPEAWMDVSHVFQLAHTQGWEIVDARIQPPGVVLVFATAAGAARAFTQVNGSLEGVTWLGTGTRVQAHWAGAVGRANEEEAQSYATRPMGGALSGGHTNKQIEFSIFVGDLAPETTNADLVAVFRNPLLGLRPDREPRVIRPFLSCRSAKIMVSPETGISKGYGFVRFTDEADQQRALIEMQGLYCLSRPMRLSHATAKSKASAGSFGVEGGRLLGFEGGPFLGMEGNRMLLNPDASPRGGSLNENVRLENARALLGVLNSADPYNTTVFVGGLSGLIAEETLRGFFAPFGEIHYVKIPPGKGCGFVQFVRKADAERAIERMQGFPIGGGKIRLSWGRSQSDKAAQAAAQAAQLGLNLGGPHLNSPLPLLYSSPGLLR